MDVPAFPLETQGRETLFTTGSSLRAIVHIVDDDESVRRSLCRFLEAYGFAVRCYGTGNAFLADMQTPRYGCLVLDFQMPGLDGLETLARAYSGGWTLPVIIISASQDPFLETQVRRAGAWAFLRKPIDPEILLSTVDKAARGHSKVP